MLLPPADEKYHRTMHRLYRAVRARVALRMSPLSPFFGEEVRVAFAREVSIQRLEVPRR